MLLSLIPTDGRAKIKYPKDILPLGEGLDVVLVLNLVGLKWHFSFITLCKISGGKLKMMNNLQPIHM
uniref:Uncharacterized protein n=1 Tax=Cannabis sativa TaxID=3483 RepID=A0A803RAY0_CANSA